MTVLDAVHADHGATFRERGGRRVVDHYGRPERAHRAVRNVVGVTEPAAGVAVVEGDDRVAFLDNAVSNRVPEADGRGCYALLLDPQGHVRSDMYVFNAGERLLVLLPPERTSELVAEWREKTLVQDVSLRDATAAFAVFGVYGASATEKIASVLNGAASPDEALHFVRGSMDDVGVTVVRDDGLTGEEGYLVVCAAEGAEDVFDTLVNRGMNAAPFGYRTWESLTLEAGTPLFETELAGAIPTDVGVRNALDFEKGCYVGQEVVARVENRGRPGTRLVGLTAEAVPDPGATVAAEGTAVGEVTRALESPTLGEPIALAFLEAGSERDDLTVRVEGTDRAAEHTTLPFCEGTDDSARRPRYPEGN